MLERVRTPRVLTALVLAAFVASCGHPRECRISECWPKTVDEAAAIVIFQLDDDARARLRAVTSEEQLAEYHHTLGSAIRDAFGLWRGNKGLLASCGEPHPDGCSMVIVRRVWERLRSSPR